jgi:class 3 adenylate cyclase/tetratricopeptide (TPR) repeat protein
VAAVQPAAEERRVVTVVFCDLVGSTALSGQLDPEVLRAVTLRYFELMRASLQAHGGTVEKFIGDAVMAVFGMPQMHEDDARRALAATLEMTAALADFNVELAAHLGIRLEIRIGVNTGEVIAAADRSAGQALVSGEAVNVAARLEQHAEAGQILLGPDTESATAPAVVVREVGPLMLKGKAEPVTAYQLVALLTDDPELLRRFDLPFVGRVVELAELDLMLERCRDQHRCHLVNIFGEAGIGKTRLVRNWQQSLPASVRRGSGRCRPYGDAGTLTALAEAVNQLLAEAPDGAVADDALELLRCGLLKDGTPNPSVSETVAALAAIVTELGRGGAVVLALDDCQWASQVLLDVLDELAEYLDSEPTLLVCVARPELLDSRPDWGRGRLNAHSMMLAGLSADESALLAAELIEVSGHDSAFCGQVIERAEGNPLYLEQLCASVAEAAGRGAGPQPLSPTVHALLAVRIDALPGSERQLLDLAAVIGREFDADGLQAFGEPIGSDCPSGLRALTRRRLIEPVRGRTGPPRYRFCSGLIQEVTYQAMAKRRRSEQHQRYAEHLRPAAHSTDVAGVAELAWHLEQAYRYQAELGLLDPRIGQLRVDAATQLGIAGSAALAHADLCWAADLFGRALELLRPAEPAWAPLAQQSGEVLLALGNRQAGLGLLSQALRVAGESGDAVTVAHARLQLATYDPAAGQGTAADAARAVLPVFQQAADQLGLARASIRIGQELQFHGRHGEAEPLLLQAADRAAGIAAEPELAMALGAVGISLWQGPTPAEQAILSCRKLLAEHGVNRAAVRVTLNCPLAVLYALRGDFAEAQGCLQLAAALARTLGYAEAEVFMPLFTATVASLAGRRDEAESLLRGAMQACERLGMVSLDAAVSRDLARALLERGAWQEADSVADRPGAADPLPPAEAADQLGVQARIEALRGNADLAGELAARAVAEAASTDSPISHGVAALDQASVLAAVGQRPGGCAAAQAAARWFGQKGHLTGVRTATRLAATLDGAG